MTEQWFIRAKDYPTTGVSGYGVDLTIPIPTAKRVSAIRLKDVSIPWNVYNITAYNDTLIIIADPGGANATATIVVPHKH